MEREVSEPLELRRPVDLEIIIPAYNESSRLATTLQRSATFLARQSWTSRIVVVDNGSGDGTAATVRRVAANLQVDVPIELIGCARPGKGAAVRRGLLSSRSHYVGFFDADLATPVETLTEAVAHLGDGATAVIGSRHLPGSSLVRRQPLGRRVGGKAFRMVSRSMVAGVADTQCGFKFFERSAVTSALVQCRTTGFAFDVEVLHRLQRDGGTIVEIPVAWSDDARSTFRPLRDGIPSFAAVLQIQRV
jgi:dolichyl-phosphate beta-glucosyltransferase